MSDAVDVPLKALVETLFSLHESVMSLYNDACPGLAGRAYKAPLEDRRTLFWRLADRDQSLIYAESAREVAASLSYSDSGAFADTVVPGSVWRPDKQGFVLMLINTGLGDPNTVVFLSTSTEVLL